MNEIAIHIGEVTLIISILFIIFGICLLIYENIEDRSFEKNLVDVYGQRIIGVIEGRSAQRNPTDYMVIMGVEKASEFVRVCITNNDSRDHESVKESMDIGYEK